MADWYLDDSVSPMLLKRFDDETWNLTVEYIIEADKTLRVTGFNGKDPDSEHPQGYLNIVEVKSGMISGDWLVTEIGNSVFSNAYSPTLFSFDDVITCGYGAFQYITSGPTILLPNMYQCGEYCFDMYSGSTLSFPNLEIAGHNAFSNPWDSGILSINLPKLKNIPDYCFNGCQNLLIINLPEALTIGAGSFAGCTSLTEVTLPKITIIPESCFYEFISLTTVTIPKAQTLGASAFNGCSHLTTLDLPEVTTIGDSCFSQCSNLETINLPNIQTLGDYSFSSCAHLTNINFPLVTGIGSNIFNGCYSLNNVYLPKVTSLGARAFEGAHIKSLYLNSVTSLPYDYTFTSSNIQHLYVPSLQSIGSFNFIFANRIPSTIYMPKITAIAAYAFSTTPPTP